MFLFMYVFVFVFVLDKCMSVCRLIWCASPCRIPTTELHRNTSMRILGAQAGAYQPEVASGILNTHAVATVWVAVQELLFSYQNMDV